MGKKVKEITKIIRAIKRREERRIRRIKSGFEFSSHQLANAAKYDQKLILMGK